MKEMYEIVEFGIVVYWVYKEGKIVEIIGILEKKFIWFC